jgi:alpha/beta superfamily hydrolase
LTHNSSQFGTFRYLALGGFSFGAYVASHAARETSPRQLLLIGPATQHFDVAPVPAGTLVVHGESDEVVPLAATLDWARPQHLPVVVMPGVGHFFHGQLTLLKSVIVRHLSAEHH